MVDSRDGQTSKAKAKPKKSKSSKKSKKVGVSRNVEALQKKLSTLTVSGSPTVYSGFTSGVVSNPSGTTAELNVDYTLFFDINTDTAFPYKQVQFSTKNNGIIQSEPEGSDDNIAKVVSADFYCLPKFGNAAVSSSAVAVLFGVPIRGIGGSGATAGQKTTVLTPTAISDWVHVGRFDQKMFTDPQYLPVMDSTGLLVLGTLAVIDPDTGDVVEGAIQTMVRFRSVQTIANLARFRGALPADNSVTSWVSNISTTEGDVPAFIQPVKISTRW